MASVLASAAAAIAVAADVLAAVGAAAAEGLLLAAGDLSGVGEGGHRTAHRHEHWQDERRHAERDASARVVQVADEDEEERDRHDHAYVAQAEVCAGHVDGPAEHAVDRDNVSLRREREGDE